MLKVIFKSTGSLSCSWGMKLSNQVISRLFKSTVFNYMHMQTEKTREDDHEECIGKNLEVDGFDSLQ